jgi:hypothetical protein
MNYTLVVTCLILTSRKSSYSFISSEILNFPAVYKPSSNIESSEAWLSVLCFVFSEETLPVETDFCNDDCNSTHPEKLDIGDCLES